MTAVEIRPARRDELRATEEVRVASWRTAYRGIVPDDVLDALSVSSEKVAWLEERYDAGDIGSLVAVAEGRVVGMAFHGPCRDEDRWGERELYALYVLPSHWGSGAGQGLLDGCRPVTSLWVLADNARARRFYERNGFRPEGSKEITFGVPLLEVRYLLA